MFEKSLSQTRATGLKLSTTLNFTEKGFVCMNEVVLEWNKRSLKKVTTLEMHSSIFHKIDRLNFLGSSLNLYFDEWSAYKWP